MNAQRKGTIERRTVAAGVEGYPFSQGLFEDERVLYHGTSSHYADAIEVQGLDPSVREREQELGRRLHAMTLERAPVANPYLLASSSRVSLSASFFNARGYGARNRGGEMVEELLHDCEAAQKRWKDLRPDELAFLRETIASLQHKYQGAQPVVFAVRVRPQWFDEFVPRIDMGDGCLAFTPELTTRGPVPPEAIVGRVDFPEGASWRRPNDHEVSQWAAARAWRG